MKTTRFSPLRLLVCGATICGLGLAQNAYAQPAPAKAAKKGAAKTPTARKPRLKNLTPRVITATEAATGAPLTPELKEKLTTALRAREAAIQVANEAYYVEFAAATGLTPEQAKEIDKPSRKTTKPVTEAKVEGQTNMDELTANEDDEAAPVTPK